MAISVKPQQKPSNQNEASITELINKGGSVSSSTTAPTQIAPKEEQTVTLRVPRELIDKLDELLGKGIIKKKRHPWILDAIVEKLEREGTLISE
jgi:hypothetical protein